ncbi:putative polysaccharide biosynthesis protein [Bacillus suaedaesalsae]|uniref:Oligosaccharide flippase family protein n=1 Tax=Bacillus suaedaesalsae TaxID=2810349 RepID=A0ABS2DCC2_9BACI|nr:oligosaccharide flippase family protein [Bacillus suaedaesalsae]MBM6616099.1 oligosaccharide flippase family protein [Bacillus suaedaesalsae]
MQGLHTKKHTFIQGALLLTFAGILTKILSAVYRVPYQNIAGDIGFYIYQQVYPFYGIAIALSLNGFPIVISKIISEQKGTNKNEQFTLIYSFLTLFFFGFISFFLIFVFASPLASLMGDSLLIEPIKMVSFSFLLLPFISIFRGYFQGYEYMLPTALSQISEQFIRVSSILILAFVLVKAGYDYYVIGTGAVIGSIIGGVAGLIVLLFFRKKLMHHFSWKHYKDAFQMKNVRAFPFKKVVLSSITISTTGLTLVLLQLVDSFTLYSLLVQSGVDATEAKFAKGVFDRGQPLIQLGVVLATSLSLTLVPTISSAVKRNKHEDILKMSRLSLKISVVIGTGASLGLLSIMKYTNFMLFTNMVGSTVLSVLSLSVLLLSISLTASAVLQGLGYVTHTALIVLVGFFIKVIVNQLLIPHYGTMGAAISSVIAIGVILLTTLVFLVKKLNTKNLITYRFVLKTLIAGLGMIITIKLYELIYFQLLVDEVTRLSSSVYALSAVLVGGALFIGLTYQLKIIHKDEIIGWKRKKEEEM